MKWKGLAACAVLLAGVMFVAVPAEAEEGLGPYAGAAFLWNMWDSPEDLFDEGDSSSGFDVDDDDDGGWEVFAGYQFHRNFAVEGGWVDLSEVSGHGNQGLGTASGKGLVSGDTSTDGFALSVVASQAFLEDRVSAFGTVGGLFYDTDVETSSGFNIGEASDSGTSLMAGAGIQIPLVPHIQARLGYRRYFDIDGSDVDTLSIGLIATQWE